MSTLLSLSFFSSDVVEAALLPTQHFLHSRENVTHSISFTCPIPTVITPLIWFHNGIKLQNFTGQRLLRTSTDPNVLYGVYQCSARDVGTYGHIMDSNTFTMARVMPYGKVTRLLLVKYPLISKTCSIEN